MNISKGEQRVLHVLAQGGIIRHERAPNGRVLRIDCFTRDGYVLTDCTMDVFRRLRRRRLIASSNGNPYRISLRGRMAVRSQFDNRA